MALNNEMDTTNIYTPVKMETVWRWPNDGKESAVPMQTPFALSTDRVTYVSVGAAEAEVNVHPVRMEAGSVLYTAQGTVIKILAKSDKLTVMSCAMTEKPMGTTHPHHQLFTADEGLRSRLEHWFSLIESTETVATPRVAAPLQQAMLADIFSHGRMQELDTNPTHQQNLYNEFIALVAEHALEHRSVDFYAERLHLSPSRLMSIVKQYSGRTVMQWINLRTIQQAKAMLRYSDKQVAEVAEAVGMPDSNYFSRFFRHEVGTSPTLWRKRGGCSGEELNRECR